MKENSKSLSARLDHCSRSRGVLVTVVVALVVIYSVFILDGSSPTRHLTPTGISYLETWKETDITNNHAGTSSAGIRCVMGMATLPSDKQTRKFLLNGFEIFMKSFRVHHPDYNINKMFLFTNDLNVCIDKNENIDTFDKSYVKDMKKFCLTAKNFNITLVDLTTMTQEINTEFEPIFGIGTETFNLNKRRYFVYNHFLKDKRNSDVTKNIEYIMLADVSDIVFDSGDIFNRLINLVSFSSINNDNDNNDNQDYESKFKNDDYFWFSMERKGALIGNRPHNQRHFQHCFGNDGWKKYKKYQISCSGIKMATKRALMKYLNIMINVLFEQSKIYDECMYERGDQAVHNIIMDENYLQNSDALNVNIENNFNDVKIHSIKVPNEDLIIFNIGSARDKYSTQKIINFAKQAGVIHQYDTMPELVNHFTKKYNK